MLRMKSGFLKKPEIAIILSLCAACAAVVLILALQPKGAVAAVYYDGERIKTISLSRDGEYSVDAALPVTLEVKDGRIRFTGSVCPDKLCEGFGWIGEENEYAICMPAKVVVMIEAG